MSAQDASERLARLTPKERACLALVAARRSSKEIAAELGIAKTSVDTYCNRARAKLGVSDRYEAARLAVGPATVSAPLRREAVVEGTGDFGAWRSSLRSAAITALAAVVVIALAIGALMSGLGALQALRAPIT